VMLVNFTPVPRESYIIGVPAGGWYREVLNSDAGMYGGSNVGNAGGVLAEETPTHGFDYALSLTVPPLGFVLLKR
jgi:1,4-alpha-glucan branching enzyme